MSFFDKPIKDEMTNFENKLQKILVKTILKYENIIESIRLQLLDEELKYKYTISGINDNEIRRILNGAFIDFPKRSPVNIKKEWIKILQNYLTPLKEYFERKKTENNNEAKLKFMNYLKDKITCECGLEITRVNLPRHKNSFNHIKLLNQLKKEEEEEEQAQLTPCKLEEQIC